MMPGDGRFDARRPIATQGVLMDIRRRQLNKLLALTGLTALGAAQGAFAETSAPTKGGTLNFIVEPEPPTILALAHTAGGTRRSARKITEGLLTYNFGLDAETAACNRVVHQRRRIELHIQAAPKREMA